MPKSEYAKHRVTVKESASGKPYLVFELADGDEISVLEDISLGIWLDDGITIEKAEEIARLLNQHSVGLTATIF